ncbi:MAG: chloramphenicol acetyltransferase [Prevotella sp.]|nr:chloramphenicol acetyltransferase [Prevotella sp.]
MREVNPKDTSRAMAFEMWMNAPMPMVTLFKTIDVSRVVRASRRRQLKFNMLMCWCIGKAAEGVEEFYLLPKDGKLWQFDKLAINIVVATRDDGISTCDIPFSADLTQFNEDYLRLTHQVHDTGEAFNLGDDYNIVGTSALTACDIDGAVNIYSGIFNNPFVVWGKYRKGLLKTKLPVSFQFHHTQMDGGHACKFLNRLQSIINEL